MGFLNFSVLDALDVLIAAVLLYQLYRLVKGTAAISIVAGMAFVYLLWKLVDFFEMVVLTEVLGQFIGVGFLLLVIVFQQEIRRFLLMIGTATFTPKGWLAKPLRWLGKASGNDGSLDTDPIVRACRSLAATQTGALIVLGRGTPLGAFVGTGTLLDAQLSSGLIESIFVKNAPLHDGALIIENGRIAAAGAILPVSDNSQIPAKYGLRHRAAVGITERNDSICIVVSEETGRISLVVHGHIEPLTAGKLKTRLQELLSA